MDSLNGQTALITGASRGIGRAIAVLLAQAGAKIVIHYNRNREAAVSVSKEIGGATLLQADLQSRKEIDSLVSELGETRLDILVNNAGFFVTIRLPPRSTLFPYTML